MGFGCRGRMLVAERSDLFMAMKYEEWFRSCNFLRIYRSVLVIGSCFLIWFLSCDLSFNGDAFVFCSLSGDVSYFGMVVQKIGTLSQIHSFTKPLHQWNASWDVLSDTQLFCKFFKKQSSWKKWNDFQKEIWEMTLLLQVVAYIRFVFGHGLVTFP